MNLKRQTTIPTAYVRRVDRELPPAPPRHEKAHADTLPASAGLVCPGCDSRTEIAPRTTGEYPLGCKGCGAVGSLVDFGGYTQPKAGAFAPLSRSRFDDRDATAVRVQTAIAGLARRRGIEP